MQWCWAHSRERIWQLVQSHESRRACLFYQTFSWLGASFLECIPRMSLLGGFRLSRDHNLWAVWFRVTFPHEWIASVALPIPFQLLHKSQGNVVGTGGGGGMEAWWLVDSGLVIRLRGWGMELSEDHAALTTAKT